MATEPSERDVETAQVLREAVCRQNWKNGGQLVMDVDEADDLIAQALADARADGIEAAALRIEDYDPQLADHIRALTGGGNGR